MTLNKLYVKASMKGQLQSTFLPYCETASQAIKKEAEQDLILSIIN